MQRLSISIILTLLQSVCFSQLALAQKYTEGVDQQLLKTIVSIEIKNGNTSQPIGTGFFIGHPSGLIALVTARHVILDDTGNLMNNLVYRMNMKNGESKLFGDNYAEHLSSKWFVSNTSDLALRFIAFSTDSDFESLGYPYFLKRQFIRAGAHVLVGGYPLGKRSEKHATPILRKGIVSLVNDNEFIVDAFTFPGNSGGPVFYTPTIKVDTKTLILKTINRDHLIGVVSSTIPYVEAAISMQTRRPRITFEDNSGLTNIVPIDELENLLTREDVVQRIKELCPNYTSK